MGNDYEMPDRVGARLPCLCPWQFYAITKKRFVELVKKYCVAIKVADYDRKSLNFPTLAGRYRRQKSYAFRCLDI